MPRSVVVALACLVAVSLLGVYGAILVLSDVASHGIWADDGVLARLHVPARGIGAVVAVAVPILFARDVRRVARRDPRSRGDVVVRGLVLALLFGTLWVLFLPLVMALDGGVREGVFLALAVSPFIALLAIPAYALSRPSAKAWFAQWAA